MKRLLLLALPSLLVGCDKSPTLPPGPASVRILLDSQPLDRHTLGIGESIQLDASVADASGRTISDQEISWRSTAGLIATVDSTGRVTGREEGTARVIATAADVSDTVIVDVVTILAPALECADDAAPIELAVGEVHTAGSYGSPVFCVAGAAAASEYVLVPFNSGEGASSLQIEVAAENIVSVSGPPNPSLIASDYGAGTPMPDDEFHRRLREIERRELSSKVGPARGTPGALFQTVAADVPAVGDMLRLNVNTNSGCSNPTYRRARVMAVTDRAIVVADTTNPSGGFTEAEYQGFGQKFDDMVYPTVTGAFGEPQDIDANGRSILFFTGAVNELTREGADSYVAGFFFSRDLFPKTATERMQACAASNEAEMFYMLVPDPNGEINGNVRTKEFVAGKTAGVLAHEFQHLVNASRRLFVVEASGTSWYEDVWLNEGLSHIAEELMFYATTPFAPGEDITIEDLRSSAEVLDRFNEYQWTNMRRYIEYLESASSQSPLGAGPDDDDLETRGAIWAFLRYAADRMGGAESALWKRLVDNDRTGLENLDYALGDRTLDWVEDWSVAVYADDTGIGVAPEYTQPSWDFRNLITGARDGNGNRLYPVFPLQVRALSNGGNGASMALDGGGAAYLRFGVAAGEVGALQATSGGAGAPSRLRVSIVRTR